MGHGLGASEGELDARARQLKVFLGKARYGVESEGGEIDGSLDGDLQLAEERSKIDVGMELVCCHMHSFGWNESPVCT